jgi:hypothetical protein
VIEEELAASEPESLELEIEYREPAQPGEALVVDEGEMRWILGELGQTYASVRLG